MTIHLPTYQKAPKDQHVIKKTTLATLKPAKMEDESKQKHIPETRARLNNGAGGASGKQQKDTAGNHNRQRNKNIRNVMSFFRQQQYYRD